jgi:hypothetical protein
MVSFTAEQCGKIVESEDIGGLHADLNHIWEEENCGLFS